MQEDVGREGVDSRALLATMIRKLPFLFALAAAGAILACILHLLTVFISARDAAYVSETEYYIQFAPGRLEAKDYYNDFTWNDVLSTDLILGRAMELLGDGYDRAQVKSMVTADILSDVRYLTITVRGRDPHQVEQIKDAFCTALEKFGESRDEFASIYKIEDLEIAQEQADYFTWRAALLGAVLFAGTGLFLVCLRFGVGSAFYTKNDIEKAFGIPVYGLAFQNRNAAHDKGTEKVTGRQDQMLAEGLNILLKRHGRIWLLDASCGQEAGRFLQYLQEAFRNTADDFAGIACYGPAQYGKETAVVAVIPFGIHYREKIADELRNAKFHGAVAVGAVLVNVDKSWAGLYYGKAL